MCKSGLFTILFCLTVTLQGVALLAQTPSAPEAPAESGSSTGPLSGYMDFHFNKVEDQDGVLDFHRFVLLFNHSFSPRIRFVGELELEHAFVEGLEEAGELELEQAYLDFLISRAVQRAGGHAARAGRHHQRTPRAAGVSAASNARSSTR